MKVYVSAVLNVGEKTKLNWHGPGNIVCLRGKFVITIEAHAKWRGSKMSWPTEQAAYNYACSNVVEFI